MLDMGFEPQIKEVMSRLPTPHQTLLFSATMPKEIENLANGYLNNPVTIKVDITSECSSVGDIWSVCVVVMVVVVGLREGEPKLHTPK